MLTAGGVLFATLTVTGADIVVASLSSLATAVRTCVPSCGNNQTCSYGAVSSRPIDTPST